MEVILLERIEKLGNMGDVVKVKNGFARNYLLPEKKALRSNKENLSYFESQRKHFEEVNKSRRSDAEKLADSLKGLEVMVVRQASENGQLYGSVSIRDIYDAMRGKDIKIERRQIILDQPIKELGVYKIKISPHPEVSESIKVSIARSQDDAVKQIKEAEEAAKKALFEENANPVFEVSEETAGDSEG